MAEEKREGTRRKSRNTERSDDGDFDQNGYEEEPDFSDPEDFVDDVTDDGMNEILCSEKCRFCKLRTILEHVVARPVKTKLIVSECSVNESVA